MPGALGAEGMACIPAGVSDVFCRGTNEPAVRLAKPVATVKKVFMAGYNNNERGIKNV